MGYAQIQFDNNNNISWNLGPRISQLKPGSYIVTRCTRIWYALGHKGKSRCTQVRKRVRAHVKIQGAPSMANNYATSPV